jgi:hypothetical protein
LAAILTENPLDVRTSNYDPASPARQASVQSEVLEDLGIWLSGLQSFMPAGGRIFGVAEGKPAHTDAAREFQIVHAGLTRCSLLTARILAEAGGRADPDTSITSSLKVKDVAELSAMLNETVLISDALNNSTNLGIGQWRAWSKMLDRRFQEITAVDRLVDLAENSGSETLPRPLADLGRDVSSITTETAELILVLPKFGMVLRWLNIIGKMLAADEPLKPALLIFSRVNELISDLTRYINGRLDRFADHEAELFATLDAASYTASIELKKVYTQELAGIADMRPTPSIYARMETAHSLLNDGFQQILAGLTRIIYPETEIVDLFPEFQTKLEHSLVLRSELWAVAESVQAAERMPKGKQIETMRRSLQDFMNGSMRYLFYKDTETVERFIEEILVTSQTQDLVPILHRFGAYLETLFGQVSLRSVLANHPFERK